ncbi:MAG TPA: hypothetical protein PK605_00405 [Ignavibacteria bacterium]|nr:hypothetical protein [Bacteroidota bacterium]HRE10759.1 hypothetical protein [Ignavibacteria bacterium]HRF65999.1 hypothetical protein [Ignavibacteria bacterium]HRJ02840.1 hypothetical protein [Ignavibacteria bacterium]HRJ84398.1 hypothetical protein [Ignavibacteria bacterium]
MKTELTNSSPEETPESIEKKSKEAITGDLTTGAEQSELTGELPVFKLHVSLEAVMFIKASDKPAAKEILKQQIIGKYAHDNNITFFEEIPYEVYKDFKVEIIDK